MIVKLLLLVLTTFHALGSLAEQQQDESSLSSASVAKTTIVEPWPPASAGTGAGTPSVQDLHREYQNIFKHGNRNAASHRWSTFLLERSTQMTAERLRMFFTGFCAVSGSPVRPSNYNRYRLRLPKLGGGSGGRPRLVTGYMHYCCWPCVCDTQDFIRIDTLNVTTTTTATTTTTTMGDNNVNNSGTASLSETQTTTKMYFAVIGNPCDHPELLEKPFHQPFGRGTTTLKQTAQEVRCLEDGTMEGATLSDHGYVIISMFFDAEEEEEGVQELLVGEDSHSDSDSNSMVQNLPPHVPQPGRISTETRNDGTTTVLFQDEEEFGPRCEDRAANGYNSGMGEIFRKVCAISPISAEALLEEQSKLLSEGGGEGPSCDAVASAATTI